MYHLLQKKYLESYFTVALVKMLLPPNHDIAAIDRKYPVIVSVYVYLLAFFVNEIYAAKFNLNLQRSYM